MLGFLRGPCGIRAGTLRFDQNMRNQLEERAKTNTVQFKRQCLTSTFPSPFLPDFRYRARPRGGLPRGKLDGRPGSVCGNWSRSCASPFNDFSSQSIIPSTYLFLVKLWFATAFHHLNLDSQNLTRSFSRFRITKKSAGTTCALSPRSTVAIFGEVVFCFG